MKTIIGLILLFALTQCAISQNIYFNILNSNLVNGAGATCETEDGNIIMIASVADNSFLKKKEILLLKINNSGDTIATSKFRLSEDYYDFSKIIKTGEGTFTAVGSSFNLIPDSILSVDNNIIYYTFSQNLDSVEFKKILQEEGKIQLLSMRDAIKNTETNIITLCEDMSLHRIMIMEASIWGDSIRSSNLLPIYGTRIYSITQKKDLSGYIVTCEGGYNQISPNNSNIISLDNNLNFVSIDSLPGECAYFSQIRLLNNDILVGGRAMRFWGGIPPPIPPPDPYITEEYCIEKIDSNFEVINQVYLSHVVLNHMHSDDDTISYPALSQNFDFIDSNNIYSCHYREFPWEIYPQTYNYFVVAKFNSNLEVKWQYYFGYDAYYAPNYILATSDGGCFVSGGRYDYQIQNQEYDVFYLKLDSTGIFTSADVSNMAIHSAIVFPNPGTDILHLESGPQVLGNSFQLLDLPGIKVSEVKITTSQQQISTNNLPNGIYIWRIVTKGKIVDSGKWLKVE